MIDSNKFRQVIDTFFEEAKFEEEQIWRVHRSQYQERIRMTEQALHQATHRKQIALDQIAADTLSEQHPLSE